MAAFGSAFGLGNLWRFPDVVSEGGGGAYVWLYVAMVCLVGVPLLVGELILGKTQRKSVLAASLGLISKRMPQWQIKVVFVAGWLPVIVCGAMLAYYSVVSGWVLHSLMLAFLNIICVIDPAQQTHFIESMFTNPWLQLAYTLWHLVFCGLIVAKGFDLGMQRIVSWLMPLFALLLLFLAFRSLSLPSATAAVRWFLYPDFSKLGYHSLASAIGHVLFSLSLGVGFTVTFGRFMSHPQASLAQAGFRVALLDTFISLVAGLLIFPWVVGGGAVVSSPDTLFKATATMFSSMNFGSLLSVGFFLGLYLSSLVASIGLLSSLISNFLDLKGSFANPALRVASVQKVLAVVIPLSAFVALASTTFYDGPLAPKRLLEALDAILINWLLPVAAVGVGWTIALHLPEHVIKSQFQEFTPAEAQRIFQLWRLCVVWIAPTLVLIAIGLQTLAG